MKTLDFLVVHQKTSNSQTWVLLTYTRNDKDRGIGCMARTVSNCPILVNTLGSDWSGTGRIYITGMGGVAHAGLYWETSKVVGNGFETAGQQLAFCRPTFGPHLVTHWHTSSMHRALTGSSHCGNLHAGIDLSNWYKNIYLPALRSLWGNTRAGSSPADRTIINQTRVIFWYINHW